MRYLFRLLCAAACALLSITAMAHHGWSGNNQAAQVTGTVVNTVDLSGPHGTMQVRDSDGHLWDVTLAPAARTARAGLSDSVIPVGAEVTLTGMRNDDPERYEIKTRRVTYNGTDYDVYPPE